MSAACGQARQYCSRYDAQEKTFHRHGDPPLALWEDKRSDFLE
jgi:hypothetical protein